MGPPPHRRRVPRHGPAAGVAPRTFWCGPLALAALVYVGISLDPSRQAAATALYDAIKKKDLVAAIAALRENRSDVNARDDAGATPLHVAAQLDQGGIVVSGAGLNWLPSLSPDGRCLFFSSDRNGNIGDVYLQQSTPPCHFAGKG